MKVDFTKLQKDGAQFESMICELLRSMGYPILESPTAGPDGGRDLVVERILADAISDSRARILVQCKHYAHSGRAIDEGRLGVWTNSMIRAKADGYLLATSSRVTENLSRAFVEFTASEPSKFASFWDGDRLRKLLDEHPDVRDCFFPPSSPKVSRHLDEHGWGVVFPADKSCESIREVLRPLLDLRRAQVEEGQGSGIYREFSGKAGVRPNESAHDWLIRQGVGPGSPVPAVVPHFLMVVGDPSQISFEFQAELGVQYYVARLHFESADDCVSYVKARIAAESHRSPSLQKKVALIAPVLDQATRMSSEMLLGNLANEIQSSHPDWMQVEKSGQEVTKPDVVPFFSGKGEASFVFAATHGLRCQVGDERQERNQGALVTSSPESAQAIGEELIVAGRDIDEKFASQRMFFLLGCFGAGTMLEDEYLRARTGERRLQALRPFVSCLAQRLLAQGASAVIGHVGEAWTTSFEWKEAGPQPQTFIAAVRSLLDGQPVGVAIQVLSKRYAELASIVASIELDPSRVQATTAQELLRLKTAMIDAKYFLALGDPASRLQDEDE